MFGVRNALAQMADFGSGNGKFLGVLTGGHSIVHFYRGIFPVMLPTIKQSLGLNDVQVGVLASSQQMVGLTLTLPTGIIADTLVRRRAAVLAAALLFGGVAYLLVGIAPSFIWMLPATGLIVLGGSLWHPTAFAALSGRFPERRATALAMHGMGATFSDTITPLVVGGLLVVFQWRHVLQLQVVVALLLALVIWRALANQFPDAPSQGVSRSRLLADLGTVAKNPVFLSIALSNGLLMMGRIVLLTFLPIYLQEDLGYSPFVMGFHLMLLNVMGIVSQPIIGVLADRWGRKVVLFPSLLMMGGMVLLLGVANPGLQLGLLITAIGVFYYTLSNITAVIVLDVAGPNVQGSATGLYNLATQLLILPAPIAAGVLITVYGMNSVFLLSGIVVILSGLVVLPLRLHQGSRPSPKFLPG